MGNAAGTQATGGYGMIRQPPTGEMSRGRGLEKPKFPRLFISYRRSHSGWAKSIQLELKRLGYPDDHVFFDLDRDSGLETGPFQKQLEEQLARADALLVLITDAPSGLKSDWRFQLSSTETIQQSQRKNRIDYCAVEVSEALSGGTLVVPVYPGKHGSMWIGAQLKLLSGTSCASLQSLNAYPLHDDQFTAGVEVLHRHICNGVSNGTKTQRAAEETMRRARMSTQIIPLPTKIDLALAAAGVEPEKTLQLTRRSKASVYFKNGYREQPVLEFCGADGATLHYCIEDEAKRLTCMYGYVHQVCEVKPELYNPKLYTSEGNSGRRFAMKEIHASNAISRTPHMDNVKQKTLDEKGIVFPPILSEDVFGELKLLLKLQLQSKYAGGPATTSGRCHPHIYAMTAVATDVKDDKVFTFSPLIGTFGASLLTIVVAADWFKGSRLESYFRDARRYFSHLMEALKFIHERGIAHLDVSLENILVDEQGHAVLIDFGLKREIRSAAAPDVGLVVGRAQLKHTHGKLQYIAPEIYRGDMRSIICSKADMWSAAVVLCNLLLSRQLWARPDPDERIFGKLSHPTNKNTVTGSVRRQIISELIPRYRNNPGHLPVSHMLSRLLTMQPDHRLSARQVLAHPWVRDDALAPVSLLMSDSTEYAHKAATPQLKASRLNALNLQQLNPLDADPSSARPRVSSNWSEASTVWARGNTTPRLNKRNIV